MRNGSSKSVPCQKNPVCVESDYLGLCLSSSLVRTKTDTRGQERRMATGARTSCEQADKPPSSRFRSSPRTHGQSKVETRATGRSVLIGNSHPFFFHLPFSCHSLSLIMTKKTASSAAEPVTLETQRMSSSLLRTIAHRCSYENSHPILRPHTRAIPPQNACMQQFDRNLALT